MAQMLGSLAGVPVNTRLSVRLGKRRAALLAPTFGARGFASLWSTPLPGHPDAALDSQFLIGWGMQEISRPRPLEIQTALAARPSGATREARPREGPELSR